MMISIDCPEGTLQREAEEVAAQLAQLSKRLAALARAAAKTPSSRLWYRAVRAFDRKGPAASVAGVAVPKEPDLTFGANITEEFREGSREVGRVAEGLRRAIRQVPTRLDQKAGVIGEARS